MKLKFLCILFFPVVMFAQPWGNAASLKTIMSLGLPVLDIHTEDGVMPTCRYVTHPKGCFGLGITDVTTVPGRLYLSAGKDTLYDSGEYQEDVSGMTIRIRGNYSAYSDPKPFRIKLQRKADLLCRGNERYNDKEWLLLRDDELKLLVGLYVNQLVGMPYTPSFQYVNVILNDTYFGAYALVESVKRNPECRIDVDKDEGYIFEYDGYWWQKDFYYTSLLRKDLAYTFKYPDMENADLETQEYIRSVILGMEQHVKNGDYDSYIDVATFASWMLGHDILGTQDGLGSNVFFAKYDKMPYSKVFMTNLWDFDSIERMKNSWARVHTLHFFELLFSSKNGNFKNAYKQKWAELSETLVDDVTDYLLDFAASDCAKALDVSRTLTNVYLNGKSKRLADVETDVQNAIHWFASRKVWLDTKMTKEINPESPHQQNALLEAPATDKREDGACFNIFGQEVKSDYKGVVIQNGKKVIWGY